MIIAFSGKRGVGKTMAADYLSLYGFNKVSFASKLKEIARDLFPFSQAELSGSRKEVPFETYDWTPRDFMVKLGGFMRYWDDMYWIKASIPGNLGKKRLVIDDCRFKNEAKYLKDLGAKIIRIERYKSHNPYKTELNDVSETDLDDYKDFDFVINEVENRDLNSLYQRLDQIMGELKVEKKI